MIKEKQMTKYESAEEHNRIGTYIYGSRNIFFQLIPIPYSIYKYYTNLLNKFKGLSRELDWAFDYIK